ncbi:hypothetical protein [Rhodanobacter sp. C01]|uniref:hypothetical protein n=1 Tax=Rhodanobacter sp. C01 TaxID=1945856 RepID=UPI0020C49C30|nr:hypothetical protein [Rhodanobacter sp. C01]
MRPTHRHPLGIGELPPRDIFRILLLRPNHRLGNTLLLTPLLIELEQRYPGAEIDLITTAKPPMKYSPDFARFAS